MKGSFSMINIMAGVKQAIMRGSLKKGSKLDGALKMIRRNYFIQETGKIIFSMGMEL